MVIVGVSFADGTYLLVVAQNGCAWMQGGRRWRVNNAGNFE
ncbi:hypothetical protein R1V99_12765 [Stenotrophomonas maltophilia]|nr:hypothetical protein [Stenotrophomonas maltophilia]